jgi:hypothetical protein
MAGGDVHEESIPGAVAARRKEKEMEMERNGGGGDAARSWAR